MNFRKRNHAFRTTGLPVAAILLAAIGLNAQTFPDSKGSATTNAKAKAALPASDSKETVEQIVRSFILEHPEVLMESLRRMQENTKAAEQQQSREAIVSRAAELKTDAFTPAAGNPESEVALTMFFDYRCGYCKKVMADLAPYTAADSPVRFVFKEFPILGPESVTATRAALAAAKQGAYLEFHKTLMSTAGPMSIEELERIATALKLDTARWKTDMAAPELDRAIQANQELAAAIGVQATPTFVAGSDLVPGAMDASGFQTLIEKARTQLQAAQSK